MSSAQRRHEIIREDTVEHLKLEIHSVFPGIQVIEHFKPDIAIFVDFDGLQPVVTGIDIACHPGSKIRILPDPLERLPGITIVP